MKHFILLIVLSFSTFSFAAEVCDLTRNTIERPMLTYTVCTNKTDSIVVKSDDHQQQQQAEVQLVKMLLEKGYVPAGGYYIKQ